MKLRRGWLAGLSVVALAGGGACSQILGVENIPDKVPDAGSSGDAPLGGCGDAGATRCAPSGFAFETCTADGGWTAPSACPPEAPVCLGTQCTCVPGDTRCSGQQPEVCAATSDGGASEWKPKGAHCSGACSLSGCLPVPPSCAGTGRGISDCPTGDGHGTTESCCTSNEVPGGTFYISYDGYSPNYTSMGAEPTVSGFRLDRFEVTVGRFRKFVDALGGDGGAGWVPPAGSGKHVHLNAGAGLANRAIPGGRAFEQGWDSAWDGQLTPASVNAQLSCGSYATWGGKDDSLPVNCVSWVTAYAFCIWDGGFLPSDAEWNFAASGGADQRIYPWSPSLAEQQTLHTPDTTIDCKHANYVSGTQCNTEGGANAVGTESRPDGGDSKWLQADMAGNVFEWTLDEPSSYASSWTCRDCAFLPRSGGPSPQRLQRGGAFLSPYYILLTSFVGQSLQSQASYAAGLRCARAP